MRVVVVARARVELPVEADEVREAGEGDGCLEAAGLRDQAHRREPPEALAHHAQPLRIGEAQVRRPCPPRAARLSSAPCTGRRRAGRRAAAACSASAPHSRAPRGAGGSGSARSRGPPGSTASRRPSSPRRPTSPSGTSSPPRIRPAGAARPSGPGRRGRGTRSSGSAPRRRPSETHWRGGPATPRSRRARSRETGRCGPRPSTPRRRRGGRRPRGSPPARASRARASSACLVRRHAGPCGRRSGRRTRRIPTGSRGRRRPAM